MCLPLQKGITPRHNADEDLLSAVESAKPVQADTDPADADLTRRVLNSKLLDLPPATEELRTVLKSSTAALRRVGYSTKKHDAYVVGMRNIKVMVMLANVPCCALLFGPVSCLS